MLQFRFQQLEVRDQKRQHLFLNENTGSRAPSAEATVQQRHGRRETHFLVFHLGTSNSM